MVATTFVALPGAVVDTDDSANPAGSFGFRRVVVDDQLGPDLVELVALDADGDSVTVEYDEDVQPPSGTTATGARLELVLVDGSVVASPEVAAAADIAIDGSQVTYGFAPGDLDDLTSADVARVLDNGVLQDADGRASSALPLAVNDPVDLPTVVSAGIDAPAGLVQLVFDRELAAAPAADTLEALDYDGNASAFGLAELGDDDTTVTFSAPGTPLDETIADLVLAAGAVEDADPDDGGLLDLLVPPDPAVNVVERLELSNVVEPGRTVGPQLRGLAADITERDGDTPVELTFTLTHDERLAPADGSGHRLLEADGETAVELTERDGVDVAADVNVVTVTITDPDLVAGLTSGVFRALELRPGAVRTPASAGGTANHGSTIAF